jgi:hypothetical protein
VQAALSAYEFTSISTIFNGLPLERPAALGVNDRGQVVGVGFLGDFYARGFLYDKGARTWIDAFPSHVNMRGTVPHGINNRGQIVGYKLVYLSHIPTIEGFVYEDGLFADFDLPGALEVRPTDINDRGQIVGTVRYPEGRWGFVYDRRAVTLLQVPGSNPNSTEPAGINNRGEIVGSFFAPHEDGGLIRRPFLYRDGVYTTFQGPVPDARFTYFTGINASGLIVGYAAGHYSFFYEQGRFIPLDDPAGILGITVLGVNARRDIVGSYLPLNSGAGVEAFFATPSAH